MGGAGLDSTMAPSGTGPCRYGGPPFANAHPTQLFRCCCTIVADVCGAGGHRKSRGECQESGWGILSSCQ